MTSPRYGPVSTNDVTGSVFDMWLVLCRCSRRHRDRASGSLRPPFQGHFKVRFWQCFFQSFSCCVLVLILWAMLQTSSAPQPQSSVKTWVKDRRLDRIIPPVLYDYFCPVFISVFLGKQPDRETIRRHLRSTQHELSEMFLLAAAVWSIHGAAVSDVEGGPPRVLECSVLFVCLETIQRHQPRRKPKTRDHRTQPQPHAGAEWWHAALTDGDGVRHWLTAMRRDGRSHGLGRPNAWYLDEQTHLDSSLASRVFSYSYNFLLTLNSCS